MKGLKSNLSMWIWAILWGIAVGSTGSATAGFFAFVASLLWQESTKWERHFKEAAQENVYLKNRIEILESQSVNGHVKDDWLEDNIYNDIC
jgi:hypothetical protein